MGVETVDKILSHNKLEPKYKESQTENFQFIGSYSKAEVEFGLKQYPAVLFESYEDRLVFHYDLPRDVAAHLVQTYGTSVIRVLDLSPKGSDQFKANVQKLHPEFPYIKAEVLYAARYEMCEKPNDVICRRMPIAFLN